MDAYDSIHPLPAQWLRDSALAQFVPAYWCRFVERQYAPNTARTYLCAVAHFALWSRSRRLDFGALEQDAQCFVLEHLPRCACPYPVQRSRHQVRAALQHLQVVLSDAGIQADRRVNSLDGELRRFDVHMRDVKGLAESTRHRRLVIVRGLIGHTASVTPTADELRHFIAQEISRVSPASAGALATALRGYLRFRAFEGARVEHLLPVIASPACWRLAPLPQTLSRAEVEQLLDAFPPDLPSRLRSYAIVRCLVDLGLRSREVISLNLDDIDWVAGTLRIVKCKSRRVDVMPYRKPPAVLLPHTCVQNDHRLPTDVSSFAMWHLWMNQSDLTWFAVRYEKHINAAAYPTPECTSCATIPCPGICRPILSGDPVLQEQSEASSRVVQSAYSMASECVEEGE